MRKALIAPSEAGYAATDIKRALLSYDRVAIISPDDRDLYPETVGFSAFAPLPMSMGHQANRPLGKVPDYDAAFSKTVADFRVAQDAGCLEILSTYDRSELPQGFTIGTIPLGGFPLDPSVLWNLYRHLAQNQSYLRDALDPELVKLVQDDEAGALSLPGFADGKVNDWPSLPLLSGDLRDEAKREALTVACRSRLASAIKVLGFSQEREFIPVFFENGGDRITRRVFSDSREALDDVDNDPFWVRRRIGMEVAIEEFVDEEALESLPVEKVLEMRRSGADYSIEVQRFNASLAELTTDHSISPDKLREMIRDRLESFRSKVEDLEYERREIGWKVANRLATMGAGVAAGHGGINLASSVLTLSFSPLSLLALIPAAILWGLKEERDIGPELREVLRQSKELNRLPEMAIYKRLGRVRR